MLMEECLYVGYPSHRQCIKAGGIVRTYPRGCGSYVFEITYVPVLLCRNLQRKSKEYKCQYMSQISHYFPVSEANILSWKSYDELLVSL